MRKLDFEYLMKDLVFVDGLLAQMEEKERVVNFWLWIWIIQFLFILLFLLIHRVVSLS